MKFIKWWWNRADSNSKSMSVILVYVIILIVSLFTSKLIFSVLLSIGLIVFVLFMLWVLVCVLEDAYKEYKSDTEESPK